MSDRVGDILKINIPNRTVPLMRRNERKHGYYTGERIRYGEAEEPAL